MKPYPHHYAASASARAADSVMVSAPDLPPIRTAAPPEFDGPGDAWSPEMLLCAAVADCFILTFRGVARAAHFDWFSLDCRVEGVLEHVGDTTQFTRFVTTARLTIPPGADTSKARRLLNRAEYGCLIANSLRGVQTLSAEVVIADDTAGPQPSRSEYDDNGVGLRGTPQERHTGTRQPP
jgi:organic hydroperoxide reductase OsmC/OhrA